MLVIGIAGGTGSGKTTVVNQILNIYLKMKSVLSLKILITKLQTIIYMKKE